jgi:flagellar protein FliS
MEGNGTPSMAYSNYSKYLETEIFSADRVKLVCMLYRGAMDAIAAARRHLKAREIRERSRQVMRAFAILQELSRSLDPQYEELSKPLHDLYTYMLTRLLDANTRQIDAPLEEVEQLLSTLHEGWKEVVPAVAPVSTAALDVPYEAVSCTY